MTAPAPLHETLEAQVRRADPDRWLASRFVADEDARADLVALYAFHDEIARAPAVASQPLIGQIRLTWWREAVDEMFEARTLRAHPGVQALAVAVARRDLPREGLVGLIEARHRDLDGWPLKVEEVEPYIHATAGRLMAVAARLLDPAADPHAVRGAASAWGLAGLSRIRGRLPEGFEARAQVAEAMTAARGETARLSMAAFPAAAYATLAPVYARGRVPGDLERQLRLAWAVMRGRV